VFTSGNVAFNVLEVLDGKAKGGPLSIIDQADTKLRTVTSKEPLGEKRSIASLASNTRR
jgi:hypothetical protein